VAQQLAHTKAQNHGFVKSDCEETGLGKAPWRFAGPAKAELGG
jgi:hypothetical protein